MPGLTLTATERTFFPMSTLVEIESAVAGLPLQEQWSLHEWLQRQLAAERKADALDPKRRQEWLAELAELRNRTHTGKQGVPLQELMDDLRGERY
jgi:hypothetical protein